MLENGLMDTLQALIGDYQTFLQQLLKEVASEGFELDDFVQMDHMCYRVPSLERYRHKKQEIETSGIVTLLGETIVNERPIAVYRLRTPIRHENWRIDALELPAPKANTAPAEGLEHVEFVLYDSKEDFLKKYAGKQFELKAADRGINPEIGYKLPSYGVKFHLLNLPTVVYLEEKLGLRAKSNGPGT